MTRSAWFVATLLLVCGCAEAPVQAQPDGLVKGTASYRDRMALPAGAVFEATLDITDRSYPVLSGGDAPVVAAERQREAHFILHPADKRVSGSGGCNRSGSNCSMLRAASSPASRRFI